MDGRLDDTSSAFITPRPQEDMLRFRIDVFRFAGDTRNLVRLRVCVPKAQPEPGGVLVGTVALERGAQLFPCLPPDLHHLPPEGDAGRPSPRPPEQGLLLQ